MRDENMRDLIRGYFIVALVGIVAVAVTPSTPSRPMGCGAYPPPPMDSAPEPRQWHVKVTADAQDASTCAQMTTDDVMWELIAAEDAGRVVRFVGCVEVVP